jgi:hypothetical protein
MEGHWERERPVLGFSRAAIRRIDLSIREGDLLALKIAELYIGLGQASKVLVALLP